MTSQAAAIQQALHGYRDGHRLLAHSTALDAEDRHLMLTLSDSPDARQIKADAPLLSGYPLPSGIFVLAMTWPAPEVRRPGCVWTHSLLLSPDQVALDDLSFLLGAFCRPELDCYEPYSVELRPRPGANPPSELPAAAATALWSLYDPPTPPVDLRVDALRGAELHPFLFAIWLQQWPALRAAFSFAQSPRTGRRIEDTLLDLQLTSAPQRSSWEQPPGAPAPRTVARALERKTPAWCEALVDDLAAPGDLRAFFKAFSRDVPPVRESLWALATVWVALDPKVEGTGLDSALAAISRAFPDADQAAELKRAILGTDHDFRLPHPVDQYDALMAIATADPAVLGPVDGLDLDARAAQLLQAEEGAALDVVGALSSAKRSKPAREVLSAFGAGLSDEQIEHWAVHHPVATGVLAAASPHLTSRSRLFACAEFEDLWPHIARPRAARAKRSAMLRAILEARAAEFAAAALSNWPDGVELLLEIIDAGDLESPSPALLDDAPDRSVIAWLKANGPSPPVAAALLEAWKSKRLAKVPVAEWDALQEMGGTLSDFTLVLLFLAATDPDSGFRSKRAVAIYEELFDRADSRALKGKALRELAKSGGDPRKPGRQMAGRLADAFLAACWPAADLLGIDRAKPFREVLRAEGASELVQELLPVLDKAGATKAQGDAVWDALMRADISAVRKSLTVLRRYMPW